ncbi:NADH dehydrogenase [ubiquinone] 1 alpha subcomplex assembly factor 3 [Gastrophryne carolinensis]
MCELPLASLHHRHQADLNGDCTQLQGAAIGRCMAINVPIPAPLERDGKVLTYHHHDPIGLSWPETDTSISSALDEAWTGHDSTYLTGNVHIKGFSISCWGPPSIGQSACSLSEDMQQQRAHRLHPTGDELYEKTNVTHLERDSPDIMFVESYSRNGFIINGDQIIGPCAIIPRALLQWDVGSYKDISYQSLSLFRVLVPKIEILVVGTGDRVERLDPELLKLMRQKGVAVEVQDTPNACATFNFLISERRAAAAALIPVTE